MNTRASIYVATAADIASNLGLPLAIIKAWAARGDLPSQAGGLHDRYWALWLTVGRTTTSWRRDIPVKTAVAAGWLAEFKRVGRTPAPLNFQSFREMFQRNGFTAIDADQALVLGGAHV